MKQLRFTTQTVKASVASMCPSQSTTDKEINSFHVNITPISLPSLTLARHCHSTQEIHIQLLKPLALKLLAQKLLRHSQSCYLRSFSSSIFYTAVYKKKKLSAQYQHGDTPDLDPQQWEGVNVLSQRKLFTLELRPSIPLIAHKLLLVFAREIRLPNAAAGKCILSSILNVNK